MKKPSWHRRNSLIPSGIYLAGGGLLFFALVFLLLRFFAPGALEYVVSPLWRLGGAGTDSAHAFLSSYGNAASLTQERDKLLSDNQELTDTNRALTAQIADLTKLVGSRGESAHRILAGVLAHPPVSPYDTLVIDRGMDDGVGADAIVFAPGDVPLGTVESSGKNTARVALYSSSGRITEGWAGDKRIPISLIGRGAGGFSATLPRDSGVVVGTVVYLPGPGALPAGSIVRLVSDPSSPRDMVYIVPYANIFSLTWLEVAPRP